MTEDKENTDFTDAICPICYKALTRALITNCDHYFCDSCIAQHCWRCALVSHQTTTCPICRTPITSLKPLVPSGDVEFFRYCEERQVHFTRIRIQIDVRCGAGETTLTRLGELFNIPLDRLKLIHKGRVLQEEGEISAVGKGGGKIQLLGTPQALQVPQPHAALRAAGWIFRALFWAALQLRLVALWEWTARRTLYSDGFRALVAEGRRVASVFVQSIAPSYRPPPSSDGAQQ
mmetsp:Transcript_15889/g.34463  ORF Transcript_15889/g.34463 Transcript_15889/m.34463 type:complete len:233 (+) Transcript_15889:244-942(+)